MIAANELRRGNLIYHLDRMKEVVEFVSLDVESPDGGLYWKRPNSKRRWDQGSPNADGYIQPIPLSEQWLLKFGFERYTDCRIGWGLSTKSGHCISVFNEELFCYLENIALNHIKYVHQLQNLFFDLGEELTITE